MTVNSLSIAAYSKIHDSLGKRQKIVYGVIQKHGPVTNLQISEILGWPINCVTGRTKELRDRKVVKPHDFVIAETKCKNTRWVSIYPKELF